MPNEIRVSSKGNFNSYVKFILKTFEEGYVNFKVAARGNACLKSEEIVEFISKKKPTYKISVSYIESFNKKGEIVDEMHAMISAPQSH